MADEFFKAEETAWKCGEEQTVGEGETEYKWTPSCAWGSIQTFEWAQFASKDDVAEADAWAANLTTKFGAGSQTQKATNDGDEVTTTAFKWTAAVAKVGEKEPAEQATIFWSVAGSGTADKDIANWSCASVGARQALADSEKAWNEDNEQAALESSATDAANHIGGACTANGANGEYFITAESKWKVNDQIKYWFSAQTRDDNRAGAAAAQTFKITTDSGAFAMTVAAGIVATAAVAF